MPYVIETHDLGKNISGRDIIVHTEIHVKKGEVYGFLGPNGAGKTTIMKMLANLWKPTSGYIEIFGERLWPDSYKILKRMSSIIEFPTFYGSLSGRENLELHRQYMDCEGVYSIVEILQLLDLPTDSTQPADRYSLGMKQRLGIARAILTGPEILILDEPANGLDPSGIRQMRDLIKMLSGEWGITILISSHLLSEIESIADSVGIIHRGRLIREVSMQEITGLNLSSIEITTAENAGQAAEAVKRITGYECIRKTDSRKLTIRDDRIRMKDILRIFTEADIEIEAISKKTESLEDYYLGAIKEDL